ncbi:ferredoxin--NADP reductase [Ferruginibacter albus]|uniref:ferredoxin--NADP reductase n=1 Tax=Ferruginibacter albus TaxID=2875540 RepID=UPI001CC695AC|nr:FAD-binding oxidoreductase [Ferruginibacter albus]UAY51787.1 oxidoreductase [Ferruginibacter albus]
MPVEPWRTGKVIKIEQQTYNTRRFFIQVPELTSFDFKPGQFVTLDLPIHEKPNKRWRSYSIASWPDGTNVFELCIVLLDGGAGTTYLFNEVKEGSELTLRGPVGVFNLHEENFQKDIFLIATGTGIAPFRSMANHIKLKGLEHKNVHLIFGCRTQKDLLYYDEFRQLEKELPTFHYHPVLSREEWDGAGKGYVHTVYKELCKETQPACFFLCGWKAMIDEAKQTIQALGYDRKAIHQELYG